jgi:hypothetical protein
MITRTPVGSADQPAIEVQAGRHARDDQVEHVQTGRAVAHPAVCHSTAADGR